MTLEQFPTRTKAASEKTHPIYRQERKLRKDAEDMLRDIAFVLHCTRRVKDQIVAETETVGA